MNHVMRTLSVVVAFAFAVTVTFSASAQEFQTKLHGKWKPNVEKTKEALSKLEGDEKVPVEMIEMMTEMMGSMVMEFTADGGMKMTMSDGGEEMTQEAKFEIVKADEKEKTLTINVLVRDNKDEGKIVFLKDDQIKIMGNQQPPIVLDRVKKEDKDSKGGGKGDGQN